MTYELIVASSLVNEDSFGIVGVDVVDSVCLDELDETVMKQGNRSADVSPRDIKLVVRLTIRKTCHLRK